MSGPRADAGYVLIQALILALIVAVIADVLIHLAVARRVAVVRHEVTLQGRSYVEAAYSRAATCLATLNVTNCAAPGTGCDAACGFPCSQVFGNYTLSLGTTTLSDPNLSHSMSVTLSNATGQCQIHASCNDCATPVVTP